VPELDPRDARIAQLEAENAALRERVARLEAQVAELLARLGQNSRNSSKPPSTDPPGTPREPKEPTGRARGGQPGHKGHRRERLPADRVVPVVPSRCGRCRRPLRGRDPDPWIHQVVELPEIRPDVTDYELHELGCECGARTRASLPAGVSQGAFGPRLMAAVALCTSRYHMPKRMAQEFLRDMLGIEVALGSISKMEQSVSQAIAAPVEEARAAVREQLVAHQDETGWHQGIEQGRKGRAWLWVAVTALVTVFRIARSRGAEVTKEMLGEDYRGFLVVDRWAAYRWVARGMRQLCWAHYLGRQIIQSERLFPAARAAVDEAAALDNGGSHHRDERKLIKLGVGRQRRWPLGTRPARSQKAWSTSRFIWRLVAT
jgi:transposase